MSQLGLMVISIGLSCYNVTLFHLINHAFYKALLFLGAGSVIHAVSDHQDLRKYGGLVTYLPLTYSTMLIASLSLIAFPYMTGYYSKDFILESSYGQFFFSSITVYVISIIGAIFTTLYSTKVLYLTFLANPNGSLTNYKLAHEGNSYMTLPLVLLAIFSILFGYMSKDIYIGLGSDFFADNALFIHPLHEIMLDTEFAVLTLFKLLPLILSVLSCIIFILILEFSPIILIYKKYTRVWYNLFSFISLRFYIELIYNKYITNLVLKLGGQVVKIIDKGFAEAFGPYGLECVFLKLSKNVISLQTGIITSYALYILLGLIFFMLIPTVFNYDYINTIVIYFCFSILI